MLSLRAKSSASKAVLNVSSIEKSWNWPSENVLQKVAEGDDQHNVAAINKDLELFARTRLRSCRVIKLLRDAEDASWDLEEDHTETRLAS
ncbi:MAG: hypothetical protein AAFR35_10615 [Pseudomonadota bacterium]